MFFYRQLTRTFVLSSMLLTLIPAGADDWFWTGNCGGDNGWFSFCQTAICNANQPFNTNNWGRTACNAAPATPSPFDNVLFLNNSNALLNGDAQVVSVTIDGTSQLAIQNGRTLTLTGTLHSNQGVLLINNVGGFGVSTLLFTASATVSGNGGAIVMDANGSEAALNTADGVLLTNSVNHTIRGRGNINAALFNHGVIDANRGNSTVLNLLTNNKNNNGVMRASTGSFLDIHAIVIDQSSTAELLADGGTIRLNDVTIVGGNLRTTGNSVIFSQNGTNTLTDVTLNGAHHIVNGRTTRITGSTFTNNGTVLVNNAGGFGISTLLFDANINLNGTGEIVMDANGVEAALNTGAGFTVTNNQTIRGQGNINASLVNNGTINANRGNSTVLNLQTNNKTNNGVMKAGAGSFLDINSITISQAANGEIHAEAGTVRLNDTTINGGVLRTSGNNIIFSQTGTNTLQSVTLNGAHHIVNGRTTRITGSTFTNNGTVLVNNAGGFGVSTLIFENTMTVNGTGEIVMDANGGEAQLNTGTGATITIPSTQTVRGRGNINASLVNNGMINANRGNSTVLNIQGANKTNNNLMKVEAGSFLDFNGGNDGITITQTNNSQIIADAGQVRLNGNVTLVRGNFITQNGGIVFCANGTNTLQNFRNQGDYRIVNGRTTRITGSTFTNNGTVLVNNAGGFGVSTLLFDANINLTGSGEIVMDANGTEAALNTGAGFTVTNNQTIRGRGNINASLVNNGTINANRGNSTVLNLQTNNKTNNGVMKAGAGSFLDINSITISQAANGEIHAEAGAVRLNDTTINGGILRTSGNNIIFSQTGTNTLQNVTLNGAHHIVNGRTTRITGSTFTNNGTVLVNNAGGFGVSTLIFENTMTVNGTGEIVMDANGGEAQLNVADSVTLTNPGSHTIRGRGQINLTGTMVNQGDLLANRGSGTTLSINNAVNFTNTGTVRVDAGSFLATNGGDFKQAAGTTTVNGGMSINGGFKLDLQAGELRGTGTVTGNVECSQDGMVNPGNSAGTLNISGNYTQTGTGTLKIEVAGTAADQFDKLNVTGSDPNGVANLDGKLRVEFIDGFVPAVGEQYRIIDCRVRNGEFQSIQTVNLPEGLAVRANYAANHVTIEIVAGSTPGDVNGDGCVDDADLLAVLFAFGQTGERPEDLTGDGIVDDADMLEVLFNFGLGC